MLGKTRIVKVREGVAFEYLADNQYESLYKKISFDRDKLLSELAGPDREIKNVLTDGLDWCEAEVGWSTGVDFGDDLAYAMILEFWQCGEPGTYLEVYVNSELAGDDWDKWMAYGLECVPRFFNDVEYKSMLEESNCVFERTA